MTHTLNTAKTVAVSTQQLWIPIDKNTPRGVKLQLINKEYGVAAYGRLTSHNDYYTHWAPLPAWA